MNKPGQTAYEAYYRAIGGWAQGHDWAMISSDEQRAWQAVEEACRADQPAPSHAQKSAELPSGTALCPVCDGDGFTGWSWGSKDTCSECRGMGWTHPPLAPLHPCMTTRDSH